MAKGQVKVEVFADRLRLRWSFRGKRYYLSIGLSDSIVNRKVASQTAPRLANSHRNSATPNFLSPTRTGHTHQATGSVWGI